MNLVIGLLVPFLGTSLGAACVFFMKNGLNRLVQKALLGFASGVMVAASVWSLLIPSIDMSEGMGKFAFLPAAIGFIFGILFLLLMDKIIPHLHMNEDKPEGLPSHLKKTTMLVLAVTLHNIPEGMAVGVVFAGLLSGNNGITLAGAFSLSIGIAIQNFPEGAIISLPLKSEGGSTKKAFWYGRGIRCGRTDRGGNYDYFSRNHHTYAAISACICSRGNDLCGRGRASSGSIRRRTFQY